MNKLVEELSSNKMIRSAFAAVLIVLALFLVAKTWNAIFDKGPNEYVNTITVEGTGRSAAVPDTARITFTVTESATNVGDAQDAATKRTDDALNAVSEMGVEDKDIKTVAYNVTPRYEYTQRPCAPGMMCAAYVSNSPTIVGYDVSQTVEVKVRDTAKAGEVLEALGGLGVQNISGPEFVLDDESAVKNEAREEAIREARMKAKELAKELGVRLGKVVSYSEGSQGYPMYDSYGKGGSAMNAEMRSAPSLPTGENETNVTVMVTYEIH
ncbi:SIMPL domain-containing protein [Patescibacteria group bacterium]|nr:SIMPL domain-containing protein [Patescibacteria group bacterium]MBU1500668.1 SIMPL domain-containing protein [Patescibacteria group bacterium]MBU2080379.1 SIMPL domain-containing protein [Patescibacteria group bacterium]MBU2124209.1 SIMPL domain-containing protein [Patescibacteria group bacterium]MBU2194340.1 SIMPL domain-containing protein [Patescibacteria group bacterium]